jgi:hypothetical protein
LNWTSEVIENVLGQPGDNLPTKPPRLVGLMEHDNTSRGCTYCLEECLIIQWREPAKIQHCNLKAFLRQLIGGFKGSARYPSPGNYDGVSTCATQSSSTDLLNRGINIHDAFFEIQSSRLNDYDRVRVCNCCT